MDPERIRQIIGEAIEATEIQVQGDGSHFDILIVSEAFAGLSPVKKQQMVYAPLNPYIADGSLHAINMKTLTPEEWQSR
jgi:acid stress-induced BolA-like protein IbaG/YrbA